MDVKVAAEDLIKIDGLLEKYPNIGLRYSANENKFVKKIKQKGEKII
ncbi:hypothetical protein [Anaerocolumna xylanovorans]|nr:hypothetical protein [Anaerocolumna xylanovorans]